MRGRPRIKPAELTPGDFRPLGRGSLCSEVAKHAEWINNGHSSRALSNKGSEALAPRSAKCLASAYPYPGRAPAAPLTMSLACIAYPGLRFAVGSGTAWSARISHSDTGAQVHIQAPLPAVTGDTLLTMCFPRADLRSGLCYTQSSRCGCTQELLTFKGSSVTGPR